MLNTLKAVNLGLAFFLELAALAALGYWGYQTGNGALMQVVLCVGLPLLTAVFWGAFIAPRAPKKVSKGLRPVLQLIVFGAATIALFAVGQTTLAIIFAALVVINMVLIYVWKQE